MHNDWPTLLFTQGWQLTLVILCVAAAGRLLGRHRPQLAATLWLLVLVKAVTPPLWSSPVGVFSWFPTPPATSAVSSDTGSDAASPDFQLADFDVEFVHEPPAIPFDRVAQPVLKSASVPATEIDDAEFAFPVLSAGIAPRSVPTTTRDWPDVLLLVWLLGVCGTALLTICRLGWLSIQLYHQGRWNCPRLEAQVARLCTQLKIRRRVCIWVTPSQRGPAVIGILRPCLVLPQILLDRMTPQELEPILAHELLHIRRGDLWLGWWQTVVLWLWWFHPLVWWTNRVLSRLIERCCDDDVLAELNCDPGRYARSLLATLAWKQQLQSVPTAPGVRPVDLTSERMERIMRRTQGCRSRTPWWGWGLLGLGLVLSLPGARERLQAEDSPYSFAGNTLVIADLPASAVAPENVEALPPTDPVKLLQIYDVSDLLQETFIGFQDPDAQRQALVDEFLGEAAQNQPDAKPDESRRLEWKGNRLVLYATQAEHAAFRQRLKEHREHPEQGPAAQIEMCWFQGKLDVRLPEELNTPGAELSTMVLTTAQRDELSLTVQQKPGMELVSAPKVTVQNGNLATIQTAQRRVFVTDIQSNDSDKQNPVLRKVDDGLTWLLRPIWQADGSVRLRLQIQLQEVTGVGLLKTGQTTVQAPSIALTGQETTVQFQPDQHLALRLKNGKGEDVVALLSVNAIEKEATPQISDGFEPVLYTPVGLAGPPTIADRYRTLRLASIPGIPGDSPASIRLSGRHSTVAKEYLARRAKPITFDEAWQTLPQLLREEYRTRGYLFADVEVSFEGWDTVVYVNEGPRILEQEWAEVEPGNPAAGKRGKLRGELHPFLKHDHVNRALLHHDYLRGQFLPSGSYRCIQPGDAATQTPAIYTMDRTTGPRFRIGEVTITTPIVHGRSPLGNGTGSTTTGLPDDFPLKTGDFYDRDSVTAACVWLRREYAKLGDPAVGISSGLGVDRDARVVHVGLHCSLSTQASTSTQVGSTDKRPEAALNVQKAADPLSHTVNVTWVDKPLKEVVAELTQLTGVTVIVEPDGLQEVGITDDKLINLSVSGITLRSTLKILCSNLGLGLREEDDHYVLTNPERVSPLIVVVYPVADLIVPLPALLVEPGANPHVGTETLRTQVRASQLIELLTSTIAPESWSKVGGRGNVQYYEPTLSLIIRTTAQAQTEIAELLSQLRRLSDIQVSIGVKERVLSANEWEQLPAHAEERIVPLGEPGNQFASLKVTMFNGQQIPLSFPPVNASVSVMPVISGDRKNVSLTFLPVKSPSLFQPLTVTVKDGTRLLLDITSTLPRNDPRLKDGAHAVLELTPRVIVAEAAEE